MSEPEVIEGEAVDVTEEERQLPAPVRALPVKTPAVGIFELGVMDDTEYQRNVEVIKQGIGRVRDLMRDLLEPGIDVMDFSGDAGKRDASKARKGLLKPGSEKLATFFHLVPEFSISTKVVTFEDRPDRIDVDVEAIAHYGDRDGPVVGAGAGSATSWEVKYHYRSASLECPACGKPLRISKRDREWYCWANPAKGADGCGATFAINDERITSQQTGQVENPDPHELRNTLVKMATKRAWTDTVIRTLNASHLFTQDVEDMRRDGGADDGYAGGYGGDDDGMGAGSSASASNSAAGARNAPRTSNAPAHAHKLHDEWQDGDPTRFQGKVDKVPDGIRRTDTGTALLELPIKVGNSKHTLYVEGAMAEWAVDWVEEVGQLVAADGTRFLFQWDEKKPPMKRVRAIERIAIHTKGGWVAFPEAGASADPPRSSSSEDSTPSTPSTDSTPDGASTPTSDDASTHGSATVEAAGVFDLLRAEGKAGDRVDVKGTLISVAWLTTPSGTPYAGVRLAGEDGMEYVFAAPKGTSSELLTREGTTDFRWGEGTGIRLIGTWNGSGKVAVLTGAMLL